MEESGLPVGRSEEPPLMRRHKEEQGRRRVRTQGFNAGGMGSILVGGTEILQTHSYHDSHTRHGQGRKELMVLVFMCSRFHLPWSSVECWRRFLNPVNSDFTVTMHCCDTLS